MMSAPLDDGKWPAKLAAMDEALRVQDEAKRAKDEARHVEQTRINKSTRDAAWAGVYLGIVAIFISVIAIGIAIFTWDHPRH